MRSLLSVAFVSMLLAGCGDPAAKQMGGGSVPEPWPELETFAGDPMLSVAYPRDMNAWGEVKKALTSKSFDEALGAFEKSAVPSSHSSKQADKDAAVKAWRDAIATAGGGTNDELKPKVEAAISAIAKLRS